MISGKFPSLGFNIPVAACEYEGGKCPFPHPCVDGECWLIGWHKRVDESIARFRKARLLNDHSERDAKIR